MSALTEFLEALNHERANDPRPIIGARVSSDYLGRLSEETKLYAFHIDDDDIEQPRARTIYGIIVYLGQVEKLQFDHLE